VYATEAIEGTARLAHWIGSYEPGHGRDDLADAESQSARLIARGWFELEASEN
jgi:hypothetical protein